jgi:hypothetical protein
MQGEKLTAGFYKIEFKEGQCGDKGEELEIVCQAVNNDKKKKSIFKNPGLTLTNVDPDLSEDIEGKHLWMLIVAHYIQSGKLIFTEKHYMLRIWRANNNARACLHGLRLCGRSHMTDGMSPR